MQDSENLNFNIGKFIETLVRQWQVIFGAVLICVVAAVLANSLEAKTYSARVLVVTTKMTSSVSFETGIETLTEEQLGYRLSSSATRLQSFVQIVRTPVVAQKVIEELGDRLDESERDVVKLMGLVKGNIAPKSDSIEIVVTHRDPEIAAAIANAWGKAYVDHVNSVYSGGGVRDSYLAIQQQTEEARVIYEEAQATLVSFIGENRLQELARQIEEQQSIIDSLSVTRSLMVSTIISNTMVAHLAVFDEQVQNLQDRLVFAYSKSRLINQWLKDAQDMRDQVLNGGTGAASSNSLALSLLKSQVFNSDSTEVGPVNNFQIQVNPTTLSSEEMVADLESLIRTLEGRQLALNSEIQTLSQQLLESGSETATLGLNAEEGLNRPGVEVFAPMEAFLRLDGLEGVLDLNLGENSLEEKIQELEVHLNEIESQSAIETDREQELTRARDLAWETYSTLATKEAELKVAAETRGTEVVLASPAAIPNATASNLLISGEIAALAGFLLGIAMVIAIEFWWQYKGIAPEPIKFFPRRKKESRTISTGD
jgi:uncharacterized protein involved in exopolysaccharide biosynthesis